MYILLHLTISDINERKDPHHQEFVRRVKSLFIGAGFKPDEVIIRGPTSKGADIEIKHITEDDREIKILVQCKESEELREFNRLQDLIDSYSTKARREKADLALLILKGYSIPTQYTDPDFREETRKDQKVIYWDDNAWRFYKATVKSMHKPYSRYAMLRDFGYKIRLQKDPYIVDAFEIKQSRRGNKIWIFAIEPEKLLNISYVFRRGSMDPEAYQRLLKPKRLKEIGKFLSTADSMLVNDIVVAFESRVRYNGGKLQIPAISASAWIIDGQHRLFGFCNIKGRKKKCREILRRFKLVVAGVKVSRKEQAKLFKEINEKQERLDRNLLLDLYDYLEIDDEHNILQRVRVAKKLRKTDMFRGEIKILKTDEGTISLATIVDYDKYIDIVKSEGRNTYRRLSDFFKAFYETFHDEWIAPKKEYIFTTNKGIRMLISLCHRTLEYLDRTNKPKTFEQMKIIADTFKKSIEGEADFLKTKFYVGKALGAGAPDIVCRDLWASRINNIIDNFLSPAELEKVGEEERKILRDLENALRECIKTNLGKIDDWLKQRVAEDVRSEAEERWKKNDQKGDIVEYLNWGDYEKIILRRDNWAEVFQKIFGNKDIFKSKLMELKKIRDDIAHNRKLDQRDKEKLKLYFNELMEKMSNGQQINSIEAQNL